MYTDACIHIVHLFEPACTSIHVESRHACFVTLLPASRGVGPERSSPRDGLGGASPPRGGLGARCWAIPLSAMGRSRGCPPPGSARGYGRFSATASSPKARRRLATRALAPSDQNRHTGAWYVYRPIGRRRSRQPPCGRCLYLSPAVSYSSPRCPLGVLCRFCSHPPHPAKLAVLCPCFVTFRAL